MVLTRRSHEDVQLFLAVRTSDPVALRVLQTVLLDDSMFDEALNWAAEVMTSCTGTVQVVSQGFLRPFHAGGENVDDHVGFFACRR